MESIPFFLIARLVVGLAAGIWLARKMRGFLRWLVLRLMPLRYRISEQSFNMQARSSAALAYLLALSVALFIFFGLEKAWDKYGSSWITKEETVTSTASSLEPTLPSSYSAPIHSPSEETPPSEEVPSPETAAVPPPEPMPKREAAPELQPSFPRAYEETGRYFAQLYAFQEEARAWAQKQYWEGRLSRRVWVGVAAGEPAPYKVLAGPFGSRREARQYLRSQRLDGFPREQRNIRLYKD